MHGHDLFLIAETAQIGSFLRAKTPLGMRSHTGSHSELGVLECDACG